MIVFLKRKGKWTGIVKTDRPHPNLQIMKPTVTWIGDKMISFCLKYSWQAKTGSTCPLFYLLLDDKSSLKSITKCEEIRVQICLIVEMLKA